jgi:iron(III) transport system ATP-binding protein
MVNMFLDISELGVHYAGRTRPAVEGVSLSLAAGQIGVLIGPSGAAKPPCCGPWLA